MARRLQVIEGSKFDVFTGPDTESVIADFQRYGGEAFHRHDADSLIEMLVMHESFTLGEQRFMWDWTHPELDYCPVPAGYEWK